MHLIYIDESGNTGMDLANVQQPVFLLCALVVPEHCWLDLERALVASLATHFPSLPIDDVEVHGGDLRMGRAHFKGTTLSDRMALRNDWLRVASDHGLRLVYRAIEKKRYQQWMHRTFGQAVTIHPYVAAFALVVDNYLASLPGKTLGMFISDEDKEIVADIEKSIKVLRGTEGTLKLSQIVEKGFFIDSKKSRVLQLCDVCALSARKKEEARIGASIKLHDEEGAKLIEPLIYRGNEKLQDVIAWLTSQPSRGAKKQRPGTKS